MAIKNSVLRFFAGLAALVLALSALLFLSYGVGTLRESWYAQEYPYLFAAHGYGFWTAVREGGTYLLGVACVAAGSLLVLLTSRGVGDWLFGLKKK